MSAFLNKNKTHTPFSTGCVPACVWSGAFVSTLVHYSLCFVYWGEPFYLLAPPASSLSFSPFTSLRGENAFSSLFDTIDSNPVQGWVIFTLSLSDCLSLSLYILISLANYSLPPSVQSDQIKSDFSKLCPLNAVRIWARKNNGPPRDTFKWQGWSC